MRASELHGKTTRQTDYEQHNPSGTTPQPGSVRSWHGQYQRPIEALLGNQPVKLIGSGDIVGMSSAEKFVDADGRMDWASTDDFQIIDQTLVSLEVRQRLLANAQVTPRR